MRADSTSTGESFYFSDRSDRENRARSYDMDQAEEKVRWIAIWRHEIIMKPGSIQ